MPNPTLIVSWPQAVVALGVIVALSIVPAVLGWLNTRQARATSQRVEDTLTTNNGGSHVKDSLDRIETGLSLLGTRVTRLENEQRRRWWRR